MYHKILAAVDEDPRSRDAAVLAEALAESCAADLLLVSAFQDPLLPFPPTVGGGAHRGADARAALAAVRPDYAPRARTVTVPDVSPVRALRRTVREEHADLLVVGSGGERRPGCTHLGRTGRRLVHDLPCALAVAADGVADGDFALRRIVVGVDGWAGSRAVLAVARDLAAASGAELAVVGVVEEGVPVELTPLGMVKDLADWDELMADRHRRLAERLERLVGSAGPRPVIREGGTAEELGRAAEGADLLVLGSRRQSAAARLAMGSTSEALCDAAACSVLVVAAPEGDPREPR